MRGHHCRRCTQPTRDGSLTTLFVCRNTCCWLLPCADGEGSKSLFGSFQAPPPGSGFSGFGSAGGSKAKDVEGGGGEGEEGEENGQQELFGGPEVAPVVQLSEVPKQTGEEDENSVFTGEGTNSNAVGGLRWSICLCVWLSWQQGSVLMELVVCGPVQQRPANADG